MKTFVLIGHHKVGTTALQHKFAGNLGAYRDAGVLYPIVDSLGLEHLLSDMSGNPQDSDQLQINAREPHNALAFRILAEHKKTRVPRYHAHLPSSRQQIRTIRAQQRALDPQATVLVSEVMSHFGFSIPEYLPEFKRLLLTDTDPHIVLVLRRPDEHIQSWYSQTIRLGKNIPSIRGDGLNEFIDTIHLQYRRLLEPWLQHVPEATYHVVYYPEIVQQGGLVVFMNELLRRYGIDVPRTLDDPTRRNTSYHPVLLEPLRRWVEDHGPLSRPQEADACKKGESRRLPDRKRVEILGKENRLRIFEEFYPQKVWFDETFGTDVLFKDVEDIAKCLPKSDAAIRAKPGVTRALNLIPGTDNFARLG